MTAGTQSVRIASNEAIAEFVAKHGRMQEGRELPTGWRRRRNRRPNRCFEAAARWCHANGVTYTEGLAEADGRTWEHAWLTDDEGEVIDLSWRTPGRLYFGVCIPDAAVALASSATDPGGPALGYLIALGWLPEMVSTADLELPTQTLQAGGGER